MSSSRVILRSNSRTRFVAPMILPISRDFSAFAGQKIHQAKVLFYPAVDSGADDLDRDLFARMQLCHVYLAHRGRRDGFFVEFGEDFVQRALQSPLR